jgi:hypothetical protein
MILKNKKSEKEKGCEEQLNARCSDCKNLHPGNWCTTLKRTVPGTRHLRKCGQFALGSVKPAPKRKRCPQTPNPELVQCTSCINFIPWGRCDFRWFWTRPEPRVWRYCEYFESGRLDGSCSTCRHLRGEFCTVAQFPVTSPEKPISCCYFVKNNQP